MASSSLLVMMVASSDRTVMHETLMHLQTQTDQVFDLLVMDYGIGGDVAQDVRSCLPRATVLRRVHSQGYLQAWNQALAYAVSRWRRDSTAQDAVVCFLSADTLLVPDALARFERMFIANPSLVMVGGKLMQGERHMADDGESWEFVTTQRIDSAGHFLLRSREEMVRGRGEEDLGQYDVSTQEPFGVSQDVACVRASWLPALQMVEDVWFDPCLSFEQAWIDFEWRIRLLGGGIMYLPCVVGTKIRPSRIVLSGVFDRIRAAYDPASERATWLRFHCGLLSVKNDTMINVCLHAPWIFWRWIRSVGWTVFHPRVWPWGLASLFRSAKMILTRRGFWKRVSVSSAEMRRWFLSV